MLGSEEQREKMKKAGLPFTEEPGCRARISFSLHVLSKRPWPRLPPMVRHATRRNRMRTDGCAILHRCGFPHGCAILHGCGIPHGCAMAHGCAFPHRCGIPHPLTYELFRMGRGALFLIRALFRTPLICAFPHRCIILRRCAFLHRYGIPHGLTGAVFRTGAVFDTGAE